MANVINFTLSPLLFIIMNTQFFSRSLPLLPIPSITDSLRRYLFFLSPLVSPVELNEATRHAADFVLSKAANDAQADLIKHARLVRSSESYLSQLWLNSYLMTRTPLPIHTTPQLTFRDDTSHPLKMRQAARAADLTHAAARFCLDLAAEAVPPPVFHTRKISSSSLIHDIASCLPSAIRSPAFFLLGAYPLDVSQFANLFSSTRIPRRNKDELKSHWALWPLKVGDVIEPPPRHILVLRKSQCYTVNVFEKDGTSSPPDVLEARFEAILADADNSINYPHHSSPIASLTSADRDTWADARTELLLDRVNERSLQLADSALFALTLDESAPSTLSDISRAMLVGDGRNRWFDKSFNLVVFSSGKAGLAWEHSWGDGIAILALFEALYQSAIDQSPRRPAFTRSSSSPSSPSSPLSPSPSSASLHHDVSRLQWRLSSSSEASIRDACVAIDVMTSKLSLSVFRSNLLPRAATKKSGFSPDALLQLSLQLGYSLTHPEQRSSPSTYEAASTSAFFHGRTETIRVASPESHAFVTTFRSSSASDSEKISALKVASARHRTSSIDAASGKGCDRHLFALRSQRSLSSSPLFNDVAWKTWSTIRLSTSTLSSPALEGGGFGPVGPDAYSVAYGSSNEGCHFSIAWWNGREDQVDGKRLKNGVEEALIQINTAVARK